MKEGERGREGRGSNECVRVLESVRERRVGGRGEEMPPLSSFSLSPLLF